MGAKRSNGSNLELQMIDISQASAADTAEKLVDAVARYGFVFVRGEELGFTEQILHDAFALVRPRQSLDRGTILIMWTVTKILFVDYRGERIMCYLS